MSLPPLVSRAVVQDRLLAIFPDGSPQQGYITREMAASTVFTMIYIGAIEGSDRWLGPKHVTKMSDDQAALTSDAERLDYAKQVRVSGFVPRGGTSWYADNTREPIRDETLRQGLITVGAAIEKKGIPVTSPSPRYALAKDFVALFDPALAGDALTKRMDAWRATHLSKTALARIRIVKAGAAIDPSGVVVEFPNGETRRLTAGPSAVISKGVIEEFAPRFLVDPAVVWLSESGNKVVARDDLLAKSIQLNIDAARNLPDIILADLRNEGTLLVFIEVVATDGPVNDVRREELLKVATAAGFPAEQVAFVTAFMERGHPAFKKAVPSLAWNTFVWVASEPAGIIALYSGPEEGAAQLHDLMRRA